MTFPPNYRDFLISAPLGRGAYWKKRVLNFFFLGGRGIIRRGPLKRWWALIRGFIVFLRNRPYSYCGNPSLEKWSRSEPISFARYIFINMTYRGVEICFASIMQASAKPCRVFSCFFFLFFSCFFLFFVFTPTEFTVTELCDDNAGTWLITFSLARISCF